MAKIKTTCACGACLELSEMGQYDIQGLLNDWRVDHEECLKENRADESDPGDPVDERKE